MSKPLAFLLSLTDILFLAYWTLASLMSFNLVSIPPSYMYANYENPLVVAWNWSFLGVDLAFSVLGLAAVYNARRGNPIWRPLALLSLAFTMAAGGMAINYWTLLGEYNWSWYLPNLALVVWPLIFIPGLISEIASDANKAAGINSN